MIIPEGLCYGKKPDIILPEDGSVWMAGGAVRRWFTGEKQDSDVDLFTNNESNFTQTIKANKLKKVYDTKNADTFKREDGLIVQTIKVFSSCADDTVDKFDFKHCQFSYDGEYLVAPDLAVICALRRHLMVHKVMKGYEVDTLRRAFKYQRQGYTPCAETLRQLALAMRGLTDAEIEGQGGISTFLD